MNRNYTIGLVAVLLVLAVGIGIAINAAQQQQQHREDLEAQFQASDAAANRVLATEGITIENGVAIRN